jgi:hypothetical protein
MLKDVEILAEQKKCRDRIAVLEKRRDAERKTSEIQAGTALNNAAISQAHIRTLREVEDYGLEIDSFQRRDRLLEDELKVLRNPPVAEMRQRRKVRRGMARWIMARLEVDRQADAGLTALLAILKTRCEMTAKIQEAAALLEFAPEVDLDASRSAELLYSLPAELAETSKKWVDSFLGRQRGKKPYTIGAKVFMLPETLAHHGVFQPGEIALLTDEQAALMPPEGGEKPLPTPMEMELLAGNKAGIASAPSDYVKSEKLDNFPVSGFPARL